MNIQAPTVDTHKLISSKHSESYKGNTQNEGHWGPELFVNLFQNIRSEGQVVRKEKEGQKNYQILLIYFHNSLLVMYWRK